MFTSVLMLRALDAELRRRGHGVRQLLPESLAFEGFLLDLRNSITTAELESVLKRAIVLGGDAGLGLSAGLHAHEGTFHVFAYLALSCRNLAELFSVAARYAPVVSEGLSIEVATESGIPRLYLRLALSQAPLATRFVTEVVLLGLVRLMGRQARRFRLVGASFSYPQPDYAHRYVQALGCACAFDQRATFVEVEAELDECYLPHVDLGLASAVRHAADRLLTSARRRPTYVEHVRVLLQREQDLCGLDANRLAQAVGMSKRTLRRRLSDEGMSLSQLVMEVRRTRACEELTRRGRTIQEVATWLGYSEPSSFHRAFRRWTGTTPREYIRQSRSSLAAEEEEAVSARGLEAGDARSELRSHGSHR